MTDNWLKWAKEGTARTDVSFKNVTLMYNATGSMKLNRLKGDCNHCL